MHAPSAMRLTLLLTSLACLFGAAPAHAQSAPAQKRGALLYDTHCIACHTTEVHWRGRKLVTDWPSLMVQVRRWQSVQQLNWSDEDIAQVARHLNARFYKVKETGDKGAPSAAVGASPGARACAATGLDIASTSRSNSSSMSRASSPISVTARAHPTRPNSSWPS